LQWVSLVSSLPDQHIVSEKIVQSKLSAVIPFLFVVVVSFRADAQESDVTLDFFPGTKIFPLFTADGLSHQLSLSRVTEKREWIGAIGGSVPIMQLNLQQAKMQGSVAVTIFNRLIKTPRHLTVYTVDYKVDFPVDIRFSELSLRAGIGHISCHFADDAIELLGKKSIQHINDYFSLAAAYDVSAIQGYVYAGFNYSYGTQPVAYRPWLLQAGVEFANIELHKEASVYGAIDVKVRQEVGWGSTRSFQMGFKLFPRLHYRLRLAYTLHTGYEDRGQFYLNQETINLVSVFIDF
jgi:hypothetical protein